jgi:hypothetical protein
MRNSEQRSSHQRTPTHNNALTTHTRAQWQAQAANQASKGRAKGRANANFKFTAFADTPHRSRFKLTYEDDVKAIKIINATNDFWSTAKSRAWIRWSHLALFTLLHDSLLVDLRLTLHIHASQ